MAMQQRRRPPFSEATIFPRELRMGSSADGGGAEAEIIDNPNPYPVVAELAFPEIWALCV